MLASNDRPWNEFYDNYDVGASALGAILNRDLDLKQEPVIFAPRADAPTSIVMTELIPVSLLTAK